jgi:hypothetical protein
MGFQPVGFSCAWCSKAHHAERDGFGGGQRTRCAVAMRRTLGYDFFFKVDCRRGRAE